MYAQSKFQVRVVGTSDNDLSHVFSVRSQVVEVSQVQTQLINLKSNIENVLNNYGTASLYGVVFNKAEVLDISFSIETTSEQKFFPEIGIQYVGAVEAPAQGRSPIAVTL